MKCFKHKQDGYLVETVLDLEAYGEKVLYFPQGGGFRHEMRTDKFRAAFEPAPAPTLQRGTVTADFLPEGVTLLCWSDGRNWNGWGMPYFDRVTVDRLRAATDLSPLEWNGETVVAHMGDDPEDREEFTPIIAPDGSQVWGVGAGSWTWNRIEFDEKTVAYEMGRAARRKGVKGVAPALDDAFMATLKSGERLKNTRLMAAWSFGYLDQREAENAAGAK